MVTTDLVIVAPTERLLSYTKTVIVQDNVIKILVLILIKQLFSTNMYAQTPIDSFKYKQRTQLRPYNHNCVCTTPVVKCTISSRQYNHDCVSYTYLPSRNRT